MNKFLLDLSVDSPEDGVVQISEVDSDKLNLWIAEWVYSAEVTLNRDEVIAVVDTLQRWLDKPRS